MSIITKLRIAFLISFIYIQQVRSSAYSIYSPEYKYGSYSDDIHDVLDIIESNRSCLADSIPAEWSAAKHFIECGNPDKYLNITQLIQKYGYPVEEHKVETEDGYILKMFRIPKDRAPVVFLMHGLTGSADGWITAGPKNGIAYLLASAGYDVWLGNARGNKHSRHHRSLSPDYDKKLFWDFSWDEIGRYDLPAMIDYVLHVTNQPTLKYVGHSQGTTSFFVLCSERPEYNEKVSLMVALAAVAWMSHAPSPVFKLFTHKYPIIYKFLKFFGIYEVNRDTEFNRALADLLCGTAVLATIICSNLEFTMSGFDYWELDPEQLPVIYAHWPSGSATKQFIHYAQVAESGDFRMFDYGEIKNMEVYRRKIPPSYRVENIFTRVAIFYSDNDWLANIADVKILASKLPNVIDLYRVPHKKFNHVDYIWAKHVKKLVFKRLLALLDSN